MLQLWDVKTQLRCRHGYEYYVAIVVIYCMNLHFLRIVALL